MYMRRTTAIVTASLLGGAMLGGCTHNRDVGQSGGRINPYATTRADEVSGAANMPAMMEYSDQVAEALIRRLSDIPRISNAPTRVIVELGAIENQTDTPRSDFEQIQRRLRSRLINSDIATANMKFVENIESMDAEARRLGGGDDPLQRDYGGGRTDRYDLAHTYVLRGWFSESERANVSRYYFEFNLVNVQDREVVFNESFDLAQQRY